MLRLSLTLLACCASIGHSQSLPPAEMPWSAASSPISRTAWLSPGQASISLKALPLPAGETSKSQRLQLERKKIARVGVARDLAPADQTVNLAALAWLSQADGSRIAQVQITASEAAALRVQLNLTSTHLAAQWRDSAGAHPAPEGWSPLLTGDTVYLELRATQALSAADRLSLSQVSHFAEHPLQMKSHSPTASIGTSSSCEIDVVCQSNGNAAISTASRSVIKYVYSDAAGNSYACSGTLLNSVDAAGKPTFLPYVITAAHCIETAADAANVQSFWGFEAATCGSTAVPTYTSIDTGATLIARDERLDSALIKLNSAPPASAQFAAWSADLALNNSAIIGLHHPNGDLKKLSTGKLKKFEKIYNLAFEGQLPFNDTSSYQRVEWASGFTEVGSSGSGLFQFINDVTASNPSGYYQFRGTLSWGNDFTANTPLACNNAPGRDFYSRFDLFFPLVAAQLAPSFAPPVADNLTGIEFYNVMIDHYFMEARTSEIKAVEAQRSSGWYRTGRTWGVWGAGTASTANVCRFYGDRPRGGPNSHFFTANVAECNSLKPTGSGWLYEEIAFGAALPLGGSCGANRGLYRAFNNRQQQIYTDPVVPNKVTDSNHRYFLAPVGSEVNIGTWLGQQGWTQEGAAPVMCVR
jgi:lysyl endopeptidase